MKSFSIILAAVAAVLLMPCVGTAQYRSSEFELAVYKGTRTETGRPGEKYSNNFAEYKINASFDFFSHEFVQFRVLKIFSQHKDISVPLISFPVYLIDYT